MKKLVLLVAVVAMTVLQSCEGPQGPQGAPGTPGFSAEAEVFEVSNVNFNAGNEWFLTYGLDPVILQSDNLLVYELVNVNDGIDTWAMLPQVYYFDAGQAQYNFNFSYDQFSLFIDADFDFNLLPASFTSGKVFRIVIIPGYFSKGATAIDYSDYHKVIQYYNIDDTNVRQLN
ncbi:MAG: hypothetical protein ITG00_00895 [Flavobacterium sp.]|nr:hypothetical protein [Flavobacterium sp.]